MKKRRTAIVAFLLVAILCLGIGFAALSDDLLIDSTLAWSREKAQPDFDNEVYFVNHSDGVVAQADTTNSTCANPGSALITYAIKNQGADTDTQGTAGWHDKLVINIDDSVFSAANEKLEIKAKVQNASTTDLTIGVATENSGNDNGLTYTVALKEAVTISAGAAQEIIIVITLKSTPDSAETATTTCSLTLTATADNGEPVA